MRLNTLDSTAAPIRHNLDRTLATFPSTNPTLSLYAIDAIAEAVYRPTPVVLIIDKKMGWIREYIQEILTLITTLFENINYLPGKICWSSLAVCGNC